MKLKLSLVAVAAVFANINLAHALPPIVGGEEVSASDPLAKSVVGLVLIKSEKEMGICTGAILDSSHILTAAHCSEGVQKAYVIFKRNMQLDQEGSLKKEEMRVVTNVVSSKDYPGMDHYKDKSEYHDISILTFAGGLPEGFRPIKVSTEDMFSKITVGTQALMIGYGITGKDREDSGVLRKVKGSIQGALSGGYVVVVGSPGKVVCSGDSGGPVLMSVGGEYYVFGVASRSDCSTNSLYTKYTQGQDVNGQRNLGM